MSTGPQPNQESDKPRHASHMAEGGASTNPYDLPSRRRRPSHFSKNAAEPEEIPVTSRGYDNVYETYDRQWKAAATVRRRRTSPAPIIAGILLVVFLCVGGWFFVQHYMNFNVTVNGQDVMVQRGDTVEKLVKLGYAKPTPGNLLAVDGSLLTEGGGEICSATINGEKASADTPLTNDVVVQIGDGEDTTEDYTTKEETVPFEHEDDNTGFDSYWAGSIHLLSNGKDGKQITKTGKVSGISTSEVTEPPINAGYRIYTAKPSDKVIALTFDDGPWEGTTKQVLDVLAENDAKATFFTIGKQISENTADVKRAVDMGCQVCTHTWDHADGSGGGVDITRMSSEEQIEEVTKGYKAIKDATGEEPRHILRAPGGNFHDDAITNLWDYVDAEIGWDVDTEDWQKPGADVIAERILSADSGNVILMHDGGGDRDQTVEALRTALPKLKAQGYKFITINELLDYGMPNNNSSSNNSSSDNA